MSAPRSHLVLNVAEALRRPGTAKDLTLTATLQELAVDEPALVPEPVEAFLHLDVLSDGIVVHGKLRAGWRGVCRRCLKDTGGTLQVEVEELYQTTVRDPDAFPIVHEQLDLAPMVREALLLEVPRSPLCKDDCAGLCPACGADRNDAACNCDLTVRDERWAALDALRPDSR